jgi:hypothetical protein
LLPDGIRDTLPGPAARNAPLWSVGYAARKDLILAVWVETPPGLLWQVTGVMTGLGFSIDLYANPAVAAPRRRLDVTSSPEAALAIAFLTTRRRLVIVELSEHGCASDVRIIGVTEDRPPEASADCVRPTLYPGVADV